MNRPEDAIQESVVAYLAILEGQGKLTYFSVPNEGKRGWVNAKAMKRKGLRSGVSDLVILLPEDHTAFIELKAPKGRASKNQNAFMDRARAFTPNVFVARSFEEARTVIDNLVRAFPVRRAA